MNKRFKPCLALSLALLLGISPIVSLASAAKAKEARTGMARPKGSKPVAQSYGRGADAMRRAARSEVVIGQSTTLLADGRILKAGGAGPDGLLAEGSIAAPDGGEIVKLRDRFRHPRAWHTATLLADGTVLVAGGISPNGRAMSKVEIWDFNSKRAVTVTARLKTARYNHSSKLLADGRVLLWGGTGEDGQPINNGEIFDPATQTLLPTESPAVEAENDEPSRLAASLPADGATDVPADTLIALRFSTLLSVEAADHQTVALVGLEGRVEAKIVPAEGGRLLFVTPRSHLLAGMTYTLSITPTRALNERSLPAATITFTTANAKADAEAFDGESWVPDANNLRGNWQSGRVDSKWQSLPPLQAEPGVTALAGQALKLNGEPLDRVTLRIGSSIAITDRTGRFLLTEIEPGRRELLIDGRTVGKRNKTYGLFEAGVQVNRGRTTALPFTIWMPRIDSAHSVSIASPTTTEVVITTPYIPGLELRIPPKTVIYDHDGKPVTRISITLIPIDRPPFPLPENVYVPIYFTIQPGAAYVHTYNANGPKGARLIYPNYRQEPAGERIDFWHYDPKEKGWYVYGRGSVSADGSQIVPDPGVAVYEFTGAMVANPAIGPQEGPAPCNCSTDGDPVDLGTGLFVMSNTDLALPGVLPLALTRTYRPRDSISRPFGIGSTHPYEMLLAGDTRPYTYTQLILPDGGRIHFDRISPGDDALSAVYEHTRTPSRFYKSQIRWNGGGWDLTTKDGMLLKFPDADGSIVPREAALLSIRDRHGNTLTLTRNSARDLTRVASPNGRFIDFTYDASHRITQAQHNIGRVVQYTYDASGRLWKVTDPLGQVTEYGYDSLHRMTTIKDARGILYLTNEYDANGRVIRQTLNDGTAAPPVYLFAYTTNAAGKVTQTVVTDPRGNTRQVTFNADGYTLTDSEGCCGGLSQIFERQAGTNFVLSLTDPIGRRTAYTYDAMGNLSTLTSLAGTSGAVTTTFTYEPTLNQIASVTDPLNHTSSFGYDSSGNLIRITDPLNHQTTIAYDQQGLPISVTDPLGQSTSFGYAAGDLTIVTDPLGNTSTRFIDAAGRLLSLSNPLGQLTRFEYDSLNRPTRVIDPLQAATSFTYDPNGNLLSLTDARSKVTAYSYDNADRVASRTDPLSRQESYLYDKNGNLTSVTDRKNQVTAFTYDWLDRLTQVLYADNSTITYTYDGVNRVTQLVDSSSGAVSFSYDSLDRLASETTAQGTITYSYDAVGRLTSTSLPGQPLITYSYDAADRLTQITQGGATTSFSYDAAGRRTRLVLANGVQTDYSYDAASRLVGLSYKRGEAVIGNLAYEYDKAGRRVKVAGSLARTLLPQSVTTSAYNSNNQLTSFATATLTYDLNGNLTGDGGNTYSWNARDELVSICGH